LAVHLGWSPADTDDVEGDQLGEWVRHLNAINAAKAKQQQQQQGRRR
jgi:hypothetical protein